jgi:hypothetical protein
MVPEAYDGGVFTWLTSCLFLGAVIAGLGPQFLWRKFWLISALLVIATGTLGCSSLPADEGEWRDAQILEAWAACQAVYAQQGWVWQARGTRSAFDAKLKRPPQPLDAKREIIDNGCLAWAKAQGYGL